MKVKRVVWAWLAAALAVFAIVMFGVNVALADAGDTPGHSKTLTPNETSDGTEDGTFKLELSVTGDADDETQEAGGVNVVVVYDISQSMTSNAGTSRYSRADQAEDVVHDFLANLATYQNTAEDNIRVSLVNFAVTGSQVQGWTTDVTGLANRFDDGGTDGRTSFTYNGYGTNWESALQRAQTLVDGVRNDDPVFVVMITDGAPTASGNGNNAIAPTGASIGQLRDRYNAATGEAYAIASACEGTGGTFYGIYAYGTEADLLDDLMYYSENNQHRGGSINNVVAATQDAPNYFNAGETAQLQAAIDEIFDKVVQAMGISSVSISDGTTHEVATSSGDLELLEVDEGSYQYWLSIPVVNNKFTRVDRDGNTIEYTVSADGKTVTWTDGGGSSHSVDVNGTLSGGQLKYEWTAANELYNYNPPTASLNGSSVDWDLSSVGTLLDGVTYSVTFDVYPSQTTLDYIADIENGLYDSLPAEVKPYIHADGTFDTNTTATLNWKDTRNDPATSGETTYTNPDPVSSSAVELLSVAKEWKNDIDGQTEAPIVLDVTRDGTHKYDLAISSSTGWKGNIYVSIGLMRTNEKTGEMEVLAQGHDFTFVEPKDIGYYWDIDVPVVHPMMIDGELTMLIKVDEKHPAPSGAETYTFEDFEGEYYAGDVGTASLTATNYRRSRLNLTKEVEGDAPEDATFPFTLNVVNCNEAKGDPDNINSDAYVWFSIRDASGARVTDTGYVISGATAEEGNTGYYYAKSSQDIKVKIPAGYTVSFINIPAGSTYTFTEDALDPLYIFKSSELTEGVDDDFSDGQTSEGTVVEWNSEYLVTFTNEYAAIDVTVTKTWDDNGDQDKVRPTSLTLVLNGLPSGTTAPTPTVTKSGDNWTYTWKGVPKYDGEGEEIAYTVTEDAVPEGYECTAPTVDAGGTITNTHTPATVDIKVTKEWDGPVAEGGATIYLCINGVRSDKSVTLPDAAGNNTFTWEGLPKNDSNGEIAYTVEEDQIDGYKTPVVTGNATDGFTVTNAYQAAGEAEIVVHKELTGATLNAGDFTFTITPKDGAPEPESLTATNDANGNVSFSIKFDQDDIYGAADSGDGDTNDPEPPQGMSAEDVELEADDAADEVTDEPADEAVTDEPADEAVADETTDEVVADEPATDEPADEAVVDEPADEATDEPSLFAELANVMRKLFSPTTAFAAEGDAPGTFVFVYEITEENGGKPGYTYDDSTITVTVTVTDDGKGNLSFEYAYDPEDATFKNSYEAKGEATIEVEKVLEGAEWPEGETLTLTLAAKGEAPMPETTTAELTEAGTASFGPIAFDQTAIGKSFTYTVSEDGFEAAGWTGSGDVTVTIKVTDNGDGTLDAAVSYSPSATITNTFELEPVRIDPPIKKVVTGDTPPTDETFTFQMVAITEGAPMPKGSSNGAKTVNIKGGGEYEFGWIEYAEVGTYEYEVSEVAGTNPNYTYDSNKYTITVEVTEEDGKLVATVTGGENEDGLVTFTNTYTEPTTPPVPPKPTPKPKPVVPKTGDETPQAGMLALLGAALLGYGVYRRRKA